MNRTKVSRALALATAFVMVFASAVMFSTMQVQASPIGRDVIRATYQNQDAGFSFDGEFVVGNEYTLSFWFLSELGYANAHWGQWPDLTDLIFNEPSAAGSWVYHEVKFITPANGYRIQVGYDWSIRGPGNYFYIADVTVRDSAGNAQTWGPGQFNQQWDATVMNAEIVPAPVAPVVGGPAAPSARRTNPLTGDSFNPLWLVVSSLGLVASLGVLAVVAKKKK